jgi:alpha,alpha-trehalose phosphorylase
MLHRERFTPPQYIYPVDEWKMIEQRFAPQFLGQAETIFATANGYLGMRGNFEEGAPALESGTFINGFHELWPIVYGEEAYGFAKTGQTMLNITDSKIIRLYVDDEPFYLLTALLISFKRVLDMQAGTLERDVVWEMPSGKQVRIKSCRFVSFEHRHVAAIAYEVTVLNATAPVVISSEMVYNPVAQTAEGDPRTARGFTERPLLPQKRYANAERILLSHTTKNSKMTLVCGTDHVIETVCPYTYTKTCADDVGKVVYSVTAQPGQAISLTKYIVYHTSRRASAEELCERTEWTLDRAKSDGFARLMAGQRQCMNDFWRRSDVHIEGDPRVQQYIRWNVFQLAQASGRAEGTGIGARGLTGQAYDGNYFWDTEVYVLPFLIYTAPRIARNLLQFRHSMLEKARERAQQVSQKGALFPWRTINGEEASAYYAAGTAQYHINADIMYALKKYVEVTGDKEFLYHEGVEMLVETARLWNDLGFYSERVGGKFCIHGVTGPDEYNTVVNNNTFTNLMARENLWYAAAVVEELRNERPGLFAALVDKTGLELPEVDEWKRAADHMYIPFNEMLGIHPQDDAFLEREPWDFANTPADKYPLLLHYHPLVIYRHRVIKQADIVLAMFLLSHEFSLEQKKRNFDFYDPLTTGDSSLSVSIQSVIAFEIGCVEKAREYARYAVLMDLADVGGNVKHGAHIASIGGTWMAVVYGVAGMRDTNGRISFNPMLPERLERVRFPLTIRGQELEVDITQETVTYLLRGGSRLTVAHQGKDLELSVGIPVSVRLK